MWFVLGLLAIGLTITNLVLYRMGKDYKLAMALALSFTALTVNSFYTIIEQFIINRDLSALEDIVPSVYTPMFVLIGISIGLNILPILLEYRRKLSQSALQCKLLINISEKFKKSPSKRILLLITRKLSICSFASFSGSI